MKKVLLTVVLACVVVVFTSLLLSACDAQKMTFADPTPLSANLLNDKPFSPKTAANEESKDALAPEDSSDALEEEAQEQDTDEPTKENAGQESQTAPAKTAPVVSGNLNIITDLRSSFVHGDKGAQHQKYIVLHDTEGWSSPANVISWWDSSGNLVAAHFVVGVDGSVYQCVPLDKIAHHAGYGNTGNNAAYSITEDGRDDKRGTVWVGNWASDYGMNAWSIGIELVHVGGAGAYPQEQLDALDALIAYIDNYYGFQSTIIDHKAWRSGNSDTSPEFASYLSNYQAYRRHQS